MSLGSLDGIGKLIWLSSGAVSLSGRVTSPLGRFAGMWRRAGFGETLVIVSVGGETVVTVSVIGETVVTVSVIGEAIVAVSVVVGETAVAVSVVLK